MFVSAPSENCCARPMRKGSSAPRKMEWFEKKSLKLFEKVRRL
jgi:hypothetical protein